jgi:zinc protease
MTNESRHWHHGARPRCFSGHLRYSAQLSVLMLLCIGSAFASQEVWPQTGSDVAPDPALQFGALPNGMRYELLKNSYPPGRLSLRLRISVGARDETPEQSGYAHFLEHMAFRGSAHFPDGEIMKRLSSFGVRTGTDSNAATSARTTVFRIDLPSVEPDQIALAFAMFRDIGDQLILDARAVESERKVVLAEARLADTPNTRIGRSMSDFLLNSVNRSEHSPIGTTQTITAATPEALRTFYRRNYRPGNATLIIVGDADPTTLRPVIEKAFGDWSGVGDSANALPGAGTASVSRAHVEFDPTIGNHANITWMVPYEAAPENEARVRNELILQIGVAVLNRRYNTMDESDNPPFLDAGITRYRWGGVADVTHLSADSIGGKWREAMVNAEAIRLGVLRKGVSQREVDAVTKHLLTQFQNAADTVALRPNAFLAEGLLRDLDDDHVSQSPDQRLQRARAVLGPLRAEAVTDALRAEFKGQEPVTWLNTNTPVPGGDAALSEALQAAESAIPQVVHVSTAKKWPYTYFGRPGRVVSDHYDSDVDAAAVVFSNGVRLNIKKTTFAKDQIGVTVSIGNGYADLQRGSPPWAWAIDNAFVRGGLADIDYDTMQELLAGKTYGVGFLMNENAFVLGGSTRTSDLDTQMEVLAAYCVAPAIRTSTFEQTRNAYLELVSRWHSEPYQELMLSIPALIRSDDRRFALPTTVQLQTARLADLRSLLHAELQRSPIEITIIGEVSVDQAIQSVAKTFGAMMPRSTPGMPGAHADEFPMASHTPMIIYHEGREDQGAAVVAWPTTDMLSDGRRFYALTILAEIMNTRLFDRLRPVLGTSYAAQVASWQSEDGPGSSNAFVALADISPDKADVFFDEVTKLAGEMRSTPVSQEELDRAVKPRVARLQASLPTDAFWGHWLDLSQRDPRRLVFAKNALSYLKSVTPEDIQVAAVTYLKDDASWRLVSRRDSSKVPDGSGVVH